MGFINEHIISGGHHWSYPMTQQNLEKQESNDWHRLGSGAKKEQSSLTCPSWDLYGFVLSYTLFQTFDLVAVFNLLFENKRQLNHPNLPKEILKYPDICWFACLMCFSYGLHLRYSERGVDLHDHSGTCLICLLLLLVLFLWFLIFCQVALGFFLSVS